MAPNKFGIFSQAPWFNISKNMAWSEHNIILSITNKAKKANTPFKRLQVFYEHFFDAIYLLYALY